MGKKLKSKREYTEHEPGTPFGQSEDFEHWVVLMHKWAQQVTGDIHALKNAKGNPDDPPEPPWGLG